MATIEETRKKWAELDAKRDAGLTIPEGLTLHMDLRYGGHPENLLDVYYPEGTSTPLPTIISIHGGGWFYGSKELYIHYCTRLALRGFSVVSFNYRLAPEHKYPAPLEDACQVLRWVQDHAEEYHIDLNNIFTVGDSADGQIEFQLLTLLTNPDYAATFSFAPPENFQVNACALNCGCYFFPPFSRFLSPAKANSLFGAYFPEDYMPIVPQLKAHKYVTGDFPPSFVMSSANDYLKMMAAPLHRILKKKGVESQLHIFGTKQEKEMGHVFHLKCYLPQATRCNDMQCAFFRAHLR